MEKKFKITIQEVHPETGEYMESDRNEIVVGDGYVLSTCREDIEGTLIEHRAVNVTVGTLERIADTYLDKALGERMDSTHKCTDCGECKGSDADIFKEMLKGIKFDNSKN